MNDTLIETQVRHQLAERIAVASAPHLPRVGRRRRLARSIRRIADRLDS